MKRVVCQSYLKRRQNDGARQFHSPVTHLLYVPARSVMPVQLIESSALPSTKHQAVMRSRKQNGAGGSASVSEVIAAIELYMLPPSLIIIFRQAFCQSRFSAKQTGSSLAFRQKPGADSLSRERFIVRLRLVTRESVRWFFSMRSRCQSVFCEYRYRIALVSDSEVQPVGVCRECPVRRWRSR